MENSIGLSELYARASSEVPDFIDQENARTAWIAKRMLELAESDRKRQQTLQIMLANFLVNGDLGSVWMYHPNNYRSFKEFLLDIGTELEGNKLSRTVINDALAVAEVIVPYCNAHGIAVGQYITAELWPKFREAIPVIKRAISHNDQVALNAILTNVREFVGREAIIQEYRRSRAGVIGRGDTITNNETTLIVLAVPTDEAIIIKRAVGRFIDWQPMLTGNIESLRVNNEI